MPEDSNRLEGQIFFYCKLLCRVWRFTLVANPRDGLIEQHSLLLDDVANITIEAARSEHFGEVYNLSSGTSTSIFELEQKVLPDITFMPRHAGEAEMVWDDISKFESEIGVGPRSSLDEGIALTEETM